MGHVKMKLKTEGEVVSKYSRELRNLLGNSKPVITALTRFAEDNVRFAPAVVACVEDRLEEVPVPLKLTVLYLIDSILKNVGKEYVNLFSGNIVSLFTKTFELICQFKGGHEKWKLQMNKLRNTWTSIFGGRTLYNIDCICRMADSSWNVSPVNVGSARIHVNPKFLSRALKKEVTSGALESQSGSVQGVCGSPPVDSPRDGDEVDQVSELRQQLLLKQKHLLELQTRKLQIELYQTKSMLAGKESLSPVSQNSGSNLVGTDSPNDELSFRPNERTLVISPSLPVSYESLCSGSENNLGANGYRVGKERGLVATVQPLTSHRASFGQETNGTTKPLKEEVNLFPPSLTSPAVAFVNPEVESTFMYLDSDARLHGEIPARSYNKDYIPFDSAVTVNSASVNNFAHGPKSTSAVLPPNSTNYSHSRSGISVGCDLKAQVYSTGPLVADDAEYSMSSGSQESPYEVYNGRFSQSTWIHSEPTKRVYQADEGNSEVKKVKKDGFHYADDFQDTDLRQEILLRREIPSESSPLGFPSSFGNGISGQPRKSWAGGDSHLTFSDQISNANKVVDCDERFLFYSGCPADLKDSKRWNPDESGSSGSSDFKGRKDHVDLIEDLYWRRQKPVGVNPFEAAMQAQPINGRSLPEASFNQFEGEMSSNYFVPTVADREQGYPLHTSGNCDTDPGIDFDERPSSKRWGSSVMKNENPNKGARVFQTSIENSKNIQGGSGKGGRRGPIAGIGNETMQDLLMKLEAAGLLGVKSDPQVEKQTTVKAVNGVSHQGSVSTNRPKKKDKVVSRKVPVPLEVVDLDFQNLKERQPALVAQLWSGSQCSSCGWRFSGALSGKFSQHLDWHFKRNRKMKDKARHIWRRQLYYSLSDWMQYSEIQDEEDKSRSIFAIKDESQCEEEKVKLREPDQPSTILSAGHEGTVCPQCGEDFEVFFDESNEDWRIRGAVLYHNDETNLTSLYHSLCHKDLLACLEGKSIISSVTINAITVKQDTIKRDEQDEDKPDVFDQDEVVAPAIPVDEIPARSDASDDANGPLVALENDIEAIHSPTSLSTSAECGSSRKVEIETDSNICKDSPPDLPGRCSEVGEHLADDHSDKPADSVSLTVEFPCPPAQPDSSVGSAQHSPNKASEAEGIEVTYDSGHTSQTEKEAEARVDSVEEVECESEVPIKLMLIPPRKFTVYPPRASKSKETSGLCTIC